MSSVQCCSEPRRFKYVTWKSVTNGRCEQSGWIAQYGGKTIGGFHRTQDDAGHALRRYLGLGRLTCLPKPRQKAAAPSKTTSHIAGVHYHKQKRRFVSTATCGLHATARQACGMNVTEVRRRLMPKIILARTRFLNRVFNKDEVPADLEDLYTRAQWIASASKDEPVIALLMVQLKYGPWRAALQSAWRRRSRAATAACVQRPTSEAGRVTLVLDALSEAARAVSNQKVPRSWLRNAGRFVCRHSGAEQVLRHLSVLKSAPTGMTFWDTNDDDDDDGEDNSENEEAGTKWAFGSRHECMDIHVHPHLMMFNCSVTCS